MARECAVAFGLMMLTSGPLWAKKAWGVLLGVGPSPSPAALLTVLIYAAVVVLLRSPA